MESVIVKDLFEKGKKELPNFVFVENVVYKCENIKNNKVYVGETKHSIYKRWCSGSGLSHKVCYQKVLDGESDEKYRKPLYLAMVKYGLENFRVSLIKSGFSTTKERQECEVENIKKEHSYINESENNGYNLTNYISGDYTVNKNSVNKSRETIIQKYGYYPFTSKESRKKSLESNRRNHGGVLSFQTKESREKSIETQIAKYGCLYIHTKESREKGFKSQREHYGGILAINTPENIKKAQEKAPLYRIIGNIKRHIKYLKDNGFDVNSYNYVYNVWDTKRMWQQHIPNVLKRIDELRKEDAWDDDMEKIFSNITYDNSKTSVKKIVFKNDETTQSDVA